MDIDKVDNILKEILSEVLSLKAIDKHIATIQANPQWIIKGKGGDIRFFSKSWLENFRTGKEVSLTDFRKLLRGANRLQQKAFYVNSIDNTLGGLFPLQYIRKVWALRNSVDLEKVVLIPHSKSNQPYMLCFIFEDFCIGVRSIIQLFTTEEYQRKRIDEQIRSAEAYNRFVELVPFAIDRIIDLLSTDPIPGKYEMWEENPKIYDWPQVDTANISKAKELTERLPIEELELLIKTLRKAISEKDWDNFDDPNALDRYSELLKFAKKIRKQKKKEIEN